MIFAAGLGTRLKPLTDNIPKALAPLAGKTLLYYAISRLRDAGVTSFVVNVHHFPDMIIDYLRDNEEFAGLDITVSDERDFIRETGGGVRFARPLLENEDKFLIHNVDIVSNLNIEEFCSCSPQGAMSTLLVSERKTQRYMLFDKDMRLAGWTNVATGAIKSPYRNIDPDKCKKLAFAGIHLMSGKVFDSFDMMDANPSDYPLYDEYGRVIDGSTSELGDRFPIMDYYLRAAARFPIYGSQIEGLTVIDAGKMESLAEANDYLSQSAK